MREKVVVVVILMPPADSLWLIWARRIVIVSREVCIDGVYDP